MSPARRALLQIHFCVLLWGFTAILGKLISLSALALVWWRMGMVTAALLVLPRVWRGLRQLSGRLWLAAFPRIRTEAHGVTTKATIREKTIAADDPIGMGRI